MIATGLKLFMNSPASTSIAAGGILTWGLTFVGKKIGSAGTSIALSVDNVGETLESFKQQGESLKSGLKEVGSTISSGILSTFQTAKLLTVRGACILSVVFFAGTTVVIIRKVYNWWKHGGNAIVYGVIIKVYNWWKHRWNATVHGAVNDPNAPQTDPTSTEQIPTTGQTDIPNDPRTNPAPSMSPEMMPASKHEGSVAPARARKNTNGLVSFPICKAH